MSDAWELELFGVVSPTRTASTDTDGDRMTDYAEFVAGTSPTNAASKLIATPVVLANGAVRINWQSGVGHGYRVLGSTNLNVWKPFSDWLRASGSTAGFTLPARTNGAPSLFPDRSNGLEPAPWSAGIPASAGETHGKPKRRNGPARMPALPGGSIRCSPPELRPGSCSIFPVIAVICYRRLPIPRNMSYALRITSERRPCRA
jgi:hypothetical protein